MKKVLMLMLVCILLVSCDLFKDETYEADSSDRPVIAVKLDGKKGKSLSGVSNDDCKEIYQYLASPQFKYSPISGETVTWTDFDNNTTEIYLTKGSWKFDIRVLYGTSSEEGNYGVVYQGSKTEFVDEQEQKISIPLSSVVNEGTGSLEYKITTQQVMQTGTLKIYCDSTVVKTISSPTDLDGAIATFAGTCQMPSGFKTVKFEYSEGTNVLSSEVINVRIVENATVNVEGQMQNGEFASAVFEISYPVLSVSLTASDTDISLEETDTVTCTASGGAGTYSYSWYVNGIFKEEKSSATYDFIENSMPGMYTVSCIVRCGDAQEGGTIYGSDSVDIRVIK